MSFPGHEGAAASATPPRIRVHRAGAGVQWLRSGLRLFGRQPLLLLMFVCLGPLLLWSLLLVPFVGLSLALISIPAVSLGMLAVCRSVDRGNAPGLKCYTAALVDPAARLQLLKLGVAYALVFGLLSLVWSLLPQIDSGSTAAPGGAGPSGSSGTPAPPPAEGGETGDFRLSGGQALALLLKSVALIPVQMALWFAPALCAWHGMPAGKAMFFSFFACWRNRAPIIVLLLSLSALFFAAVVVFASLIAALGLGEAAAQYLFAPLLLSSWVVAQACNLAMYKAIVDQDAGDGLPAAAP